MNRQLEFYDRVQKKWVLSGESIHGLTQSNARKVADTFARVLDNPYRIVEYRAFECYRALPRRKKK